MVVMKMKFPFQKRVKLAQGLWLLSWMATVAGALTFALGCLLKTELRRRAEVGGRGGEERGGERGGGGGGGGE